MAVARALSFLVVFGLGCTGARDAEPPRPAQVTEQRSLVSVTTKRALGASCDDVGREGCTGGVCLKVAAERGRGRRCSRSCAEDHLSCGPGFGCAQVFPTAEAWFCAPLSPEEEATR